jgi:hypothetical protein
LAALITLLFFVIPTKTPFSDAPEDLNFEFYKAQVHFRRESMIIHGGIFLTMIMSTKATEEWRPLTTILVTTAMFSQIYLVIEALILV